MMLLLALAAAALAPPTLTATEVTRMAAAEAHQGVVADGRFLWAISNSEIGKYDRRTRQRVAVWQGDPAHFRHMNSCILKDATLVCAASNYPDVPMASAIEWFDAERMTHIATRSLGPRYGSLTWVDWHGGSWWACFANYDGKGGEPGRDHRATTLVRYTPDFVEQGAWLFPDDVLDRFAPRSASGGAWGEDGLLYVTGHDRPELYVLKVPDGGPVLDHVATIAIPTDGQAIAWEAGARRILWSIERATKEAVAARIPPVGPNGR